ncbi:MAG: lysine transporter LysE [Chloroflexi bacterium]|nr:lysine transporter LysE [Chloroflexota bacterium]
MATSFIAGALAGWAIAIPVGAIAILIIETGIRRGFAAAAAAGAGAAAADGIYVTLAVVGGAALATTIAPIMEPLRIVAIGALLAIGLRGLIRLSRTSRDGPAATDPPGSLGGTFLRFLGLTILNPATVIYFAALIVALPDIGRDAQTRAAFAAGAFLASLAWQMVLAAFSAFAHHRLPQRVQIGISVLGNLVICGFAVLLALDL